MTESRSLKQLLRIRALEEEQSRALLEAALGELHRMEASLVLNQQREVRGRRLVAQSHRRAGDEIQGIDRRAGIEESVAARRSIAAITPRVEVQKQVVEEMRRIFLARRVDRRQAETLIVEAAARAEVESSRRAQRTMDDWFGARISRGEGRLLGGTAKRAEHERRES